ncbi:hypothetical protein MASR2M12_11780 [Bacteroidales bacterium]
MEIHYLKDGKLRSELIPLNFIDKDGIINSGYIDTVKFSYLDSISYPDMNPDHEKRFTTPYTLDFSKKISPYSPEYFTAYAIHNIINVIEYYNRLFDNKIDFNSQTEYKNIEIIMGDIPLLTSPNTYIIKEKSNPSPSLFSHEIGHRAFWYIEGKLGVKFNGLTVVHLGLLEYFTVSYNNSPIVGEDFLPKKLMRNTSQLHRNSLDSSLVLRNTFRFLEESFPIETKNQKSNISKYLSTCYAAYNDYILDNIYDNHRGGMILTSTLWRIREKIGQEKADQLVAKTILNLNDYLDKRSEFYQSPEKEKQNMIEWYDVYYGLIQKDKELFGGKNTQLIADEFAQTGYPIETIKY